MSIRPSFLNQIHLATASKKEDGSASFLEQIHLAVVSLKEGGAPDWIQVFPKGPDLKTNDGRAFKMSDPAALASALNQHRQPVLIDYDHRSHYAADDGGSTEAAGWLTKFEARDGALWGLVEWTEKASTAISQKLYRFISPEFLTNKKTGEVAGIKAAALLNRPAFEMTALASEQKTKEPNMLKTIAKALGLDENADEKTILAAIEKSSADHKTELASAQAKAKTPSTDEFMPRADYDTVLARATTAEEKLAAKDKETFGKKVETMIASAIKAGKITPASKDHYVALCTSEETFETTRKALEVSPEVIGKTEISGKVGEDSHLTAEQKTMAARLGIAEEDYAKTLADDKAA